jgi:RNA polymerase sigma-70 factor (ECF subfamily)
LAKTDPTQLFYELVWPHRALIARAARIQTGNAAEADDLAQETLLKAFRSIDTFRAGTQVRAWLLTILRNTRIDRARVTASAAKFVGLDEAAVEASDSAGEPQGSLHDAGQLLAAFSDAEVIDALQNISEDLRWTLLLVDVEGIDHKEAAEILAVPVGTVKSRVHRGRALLRQALLPLARDRRLVE